MSRHRGAITRRQAIIGAGAAAAGALVHARATSAGPAIEPIVKRGRLRQSVSRWCYKSIPLPYLCRTAADMGLTAIDLLEESEWPVARQYGLICSMGYAGGGSIRDGMNVAANHEAIVANFTKSIPHAAELHVANVITFFGNRRGLSDQEGIARSVEGLNLVKKIAEDHGVTICVELLNSKVDHKDYQGDHTAFGVEVVKAVDSPRVKLLYDIYHMQIMEGDIIRTIRTNHQFIGHYHTGGVPGRHELDDTQELNWQTVCRAIADTGFQGFVAHEFVPTRDPLTSLREAVALCDV
jgi:hydroxypyruvate isomerase